jgi:hypothetical protein
MTVVIKRVDFAFNWPEDEIWPGYQNPYKRSRQDCSFCEGTGSSPVARRLNNLWYGYEPFRPEDRGSVPFLPSEPHVIARAAQNLSHRSWHPGNYDEALNLEAVRLCAHWNASWSHHLNQDDVDALIGEGRLWDLTRTYVQGQGWVDKQPLAKPTPREVGEWSCSGMGHDSINCFICIRAECERLGQRSECERCGGNGKSWPSEQVKAAHEAWTPTEPPGGDGYQAWEFINEGAPISPVFDTLEALSTWAKANDLEITAQVEAALDQTA